MLELGDKNGFQTEKVCLFLTWQIGEAQHKSDMSACVLW